MSQRTIADTELDEIATDVRTRFGEEFPPAPAPGSPENDDDRLMREEKTEAAVYDALRTVNRERIAQQRLPLTEDDEVAVCRRIIDAMFGIARLAELMRDDQVENIRVEGNRPVRVDYADGRCEELPPLVERAGDLVHLIREQAVQADRPFSYADPWVDIQLADGSRFHATGWVSKIPLFTIRRHRFLRVGLDDLFELGSLEQGLSAMLAAAVHTGMVIIVTGAMNSGKTTLLRALCLEIDPEEIVVSVETDYELGLSASGHLRWVTELQSRPAAVVGGRSITCSDLMTPTVRMNANRVIVGEVREDEAVALIDAVSVGRGAMSTVHGLSAENGLQRLATLMSRHEPSIPYHLARRMVYEGVDLVVHCHKSRENRYVSEVMAPSVAGDEPVSTPMYKPGPDGRAVPTGLFDEMFVERLEVADPLFDRRVFDDAPLLRPLRVRPEWAMS